MPLHSSPHFGRRYQSNGTHWTNIGISLAPELICSLYSIDKFYLLARRYVAAGFRFLESQDWKIEFLEEYNSMLSEGPLQCVLPFRMEKLILALRTQRSQIQYDII